MTMSNAGEGELERGRREPRDDSGLLCGRHLPPSFDLQSLDLGWRIGAERLARHIRLWRRSTRRTTIVRLVASDYCFNCGIRLSGSFCSNCGQKAQELNPSLRHLLHDLTHELLHVDGKIFRSVGTLLARPGLLTRDSFEGRRVRWISAIRLYLIFSLVYFAVVATEPGIRERAVKAGTYVMGVVLVPVFAWLTQFVARNPLKFPQHLIFALHVHAVWFAAFSFMELTRAGLSRVFNSTRPIGWIVAAYACVYTILAFRKAYGQSLTRSVLKMMVVMVAYVIVLGFAIVGVALAVR